MFRPFSPVFTSKHRRQLKPNGGTDALRNHAGTTNPPGWPDPFSCALLNPNATSSSLDRQEDRAVGSELSQLSGAPLPSRSYYSRVCPRFGLGLGLAA